MTAEDALEGSVNAEHTRKRAAVLTRMDAVKGDNLTRKAAAVSPLDPNRLSAARQPSTPGRRRLIRAILRSSGVTRRNCPEPLRVRE